MTQLSCARTPRGLQFARAESAVSVAEIKALIDGLQKNFEAFKSENDAALKAATKDVVQAEKVDRINAEIGRQQKLIDDLSAQLTTARLGGKDDPGAPKNSKHTKAFASYFRRGAESELAEIHAAATRDSNPDGGYIVPVEVETAVDRVLSKYSAMRQIAMVRAISAQSYRKPIMTGAAAAGWVGEKESRTTTNSPTLALLEFPAMELYAMPAASQSIIDDASLNIETWLADEVGIVFGEQEGAAFVSGTGVNQPFGFLSQTIVADASWAWGKIGYTASGGAGAFASSNPSDNLIDLVYSLKQGYRANATWIMNRKTQGAVRKLKDGQGNYIWQPGAQAGQPAVLMGYPVADDDNMPDIAANSYSIAIGDFKRGYLIVDRVGVRVLRDPFSSKPYVLFYTTKRVGGGVQNFEAIKLMKFAAS